MSNEKRTFPKWFITMMQDMLDMRDAQKEYFQQPSNFRLRNAKLKEDKADSHLEGCLREGLIIHKTKNISQTPTLFNGNGKDS